MAGRRQNLRAKRGAGGQTSRAPFGPPQRVPTRRKGCSIWMTALCGRGRASKTALNQTQPDARLTNQKARCDSCPRSPRSLLSDALIGKTPQFCGVLFLAPLRSILAQKVPLCDFTAAATSGR